MREARVRRHPKGFAALLVAAALLLGFEAGAQEELSPTAVQSPTAPAPTYPTALEAYLERPGILLVKRHHPLPPVALPGGGEVRLDAVTAHEPGMEHQRMMGIRVEIDAAGLPDRERVVYIDVHEIEDLVRGIGFMLSPVEGEVSAQGNDRTEMSISTRDDLELGAVFAAVGTSYFLRTPSASFAVQRDALAALSGALDEGRERLFSHY